MEDNIQIFLGVFISIFLLFIFPVYMAFEKKDDISYALAMRYTQDFVDTVKTKGYITKDMYADYRKKLAITGNSYDVEMVHDQVRIDPIVQFYKSKGEGENKTYELALTMSQDEKRALDEKAINSAIGNPDINIFKYSSEQAKKAYLDVYYKGVGYDKIIETYVVSKQTYTTDHIAAILELENKLWLDATTDNFRCVDEQFQEDLTASPKRVATCQYAYTMNENDMFTVTIKNTNITPATLIYNMLTGNTIENNTRIFVNYGGVILNSRWYGKIDYSKMKHDNLDLYQMKLIDISYIFGEAIFKKEQTLGMARQLPFPSSYKDYMIELEARPFDTTDLQKEGHLIKSNDELEGYNFALGRNSEKGLNVSIGLNGISMVALDNGKSTVILSYPTPITKYTKIRIKVAKSLKNSRKYQVILYINDRRVAESIEVNNKLLVYSAGEGFIKKNVGQFFSGAIRNIKIYYNE